MATKKRRTTKKRATKKRTTSKAGNIFKTASRNKAFAAAKRAVKKAMARKKAAWKKAVSVARKKKR